MRHVTMEENHVAWVQFKMVFSVITGIRWQISPMDYVALGTKMPLCRLKPCHLKLESGWQGLLL